MKVTRLWAMAAVLALGAGRQAIADLIVQKDGTVVEGRVLSRDAKGLSVQLDGKTGQPVQLTAAIVERVIQVDSKGAAVAEGAGVSVPAKRPEPRWGFPAEPVAPPIVPAASGPTYYLIQLHGEVGDTYTADLLEKALADAAKRKPTAVVLDINSPGGKVSEAETMIKTMHHYNKELRIVALVDQDLSASAIVSLSARDIFMKPTGIFGAATAYADDDWFGPRLLREKYQSAWRAVARNSAEEGGHEPLLAEAMIDNLMELHVETVDGKKVVQEGPGPNMLTKPGRILTLTSREAVNCGLVADIVEDLKELGEKLKYKDWKECQGLGAALADHAAKRREVYEQRMKEIETDFRANLAAAESAMPSEGPITRQFSIGRGTISGADEPRPRFTMEEFRVPTPRQRAEWNGHSLTAVVAIQKAEQNVQDHMALETAFNHKEIDPEMKVLQTALGEVRARLYDARHKYADEADAAPPIATTPLRSPAVSRGPGSAQTAPVTAVTAPPLNLKLAPVPLPLLEIAKQAVDKGNYSTGKAVAVGGSTVVVDTVSGGGLLIGLRCGFSPTQSDHIASIQAIYLTARGVVMGTLIGDPNAHPVANLVARDGYAVGGWMIDGDLKGLRLRFMRIGDAGLIPTDSYESEVLGRVGRPNRVESGMPAVGVFGQVLRQEQILTFTPLTMNSPEASPASTPPATGRPPSSPARTPVTSATMPRGARGPISPSRSARPAGSPTQSPGNLPARVNSDGATVVNFDDLRAGAVDDKLASSGIVYANIDVINGRGHGEIVVPSGGQFMCVRNENGRPTMEGAIWFVSPADPNQAAVTDHVSFNLVGLKSGSGYFNGVTISALGSGGQVLDEYTSQPVGPNQGRDITAVTLKRPGIAKITFTPIPNPHNANALTGPLDDLEFGPLTAPGAPETKTAASHPAE
jgi:hypothetical protein